MEGERNRGKDRIRDTRKIEREERGRDGGREEKERSEIEISFTYLRRLVIISLELDSTCRSHDCHMTSEHNEYAQQVTTYQQQNAIIE